MTLEQFKEKAIVTKFNTCNGWGFGGSFGISYRYGDWYMEIAKYSTRHQGTHVNNQYRNDKESPYTLYNKKEFELAIKNIS